ncbi:putative basic amino acid antiporter YfcC [Aminipila butyrica]|uniref:Putative basic amino acid antiporter YfcC n=1 Tax=Aminipila butyrica TaxID=433296 RepID=A0A858BY69_9FIRM|nr:putative basic amino acid antiporter YfcC [Aminipila butyrica]QIB69850.1 putative basic amino acid antiporter YfcC [Aminipila butyrica]
MKEHDEQNLQRLEKGLTRFQAPHTYAIIFFVVLVMWVLTFIIPAGKFSTHDVSYLDANGVEKTKTVLMAETFRYAYDFDKAKLDTALEGLSGDTVKLEELEVDPAALSDFLATDQADWSQSGLDEIGLTEPVLYDLYGQTIYDTSHKLHNTATLWGTEDYGGFGVLNYLFEGLVTGDKYGSAVGIVALILVVGGAFGIIMRTGAVEAGIYAFIRKSNGTERYFLPVLFVIFSLGGATFGMAEECIPFAMIMVPFVIAMGYDSIVAITVTYVASQVGNAASWMNPFGVAIAQGIAEIPILSGASFRIVMFVVITLAAAGYMMVYAERIRKNPQLSAVYEIDAYFRNKISAESEGAHGEFKLGHKLILLDMLLVLIWIVWGVVKEGYYIPEIASQFFVMGLVAGIIAIIFKLNDMTINGMASAFQSGVADLAGTAVVVGMAKGILLVLGGSDASVASSLNTILYGMGHAMGGLPAVVTGWLMYVFQSLFNLIVTSNSGQAALTMPIMAPLADIVGVTRQVAVLAFQLGSGFVDAFTPCSASLLGVLGVARINWMKWAKFQIKMQAFLFALGSIFIVIAVATGLS